MKKHLLALLLSALFLPSHGQEMWGISNSNYTGSMGIALNPSTIVGAPYKYDINILAFDIFLQNNMAWIPAKDRLLYNAFSGSSHEPTVIVDDYSRTTKSAFVHATVLGPSFMWTADQKQSIGLHTTFRTEAGLLKVPYLFNNLGQEFGDNTSTTHDFTVPGFSIAALNWAEVGVTYGKVMKNETKKYIKWGATLNYIIPFNGAYIDVSDINYTTTDSTANVQNIDARIGHSLYNGDGGQGVLASRGWGLGTTIGVTYIKGRSPRAYSLKKAADKLQKYKYRLGASLMDVGFARFNDEDARLVKLHSSGAFSSNDLSHLQFGSPKRFDNTIINSVGGSVGNIPFNIWLPTAISVQFDYALSEHWYANATVLNRIHFLPNQVARGNQDVISLRYERRHFEMAANLNLFEYSALSTGFAFRYRCFIFGTDRLSQMASLADFNAIDLYFGFKVNFTSLPQRTKRIVTCPAYKAN